MVCTLIVKDICHHSGQSVVRSHCVTHWCVWFCLYSYWQQWIGLSDCDITANYDKIRYSYTFYVINVKCDTLYMDVMWQRGSWCWILWVVIQGNMVIILPLSDTEVQTVSWRQIRWKVYPRELKKKIEYNLVTCILGWQYQMMTY